MLKYFDTPVDEISAEILNEKGVRLFVKREDRNHPFVSGNKWWKLKYNFEEAKTLGLVNHVVPAEELLAKAKEILNKIAQKSPLAR